MELPSYRVRISYSWLEIHDAVKAWDEFCKGGIVLYQHNDGNRPHCHLWLDSVTCSTDTLKNVFKRKKGCGNLGNKGWSFKEGDDDEIMSYLTYCSKGEYTPQFNSTEISIIDPADSEQQQELFAVKDETTGPFWEAIKNNWVTFNKPQDDTNSKLTKYEIVQKVIQSGIDLNDIEDVVKEIIKVLKESKQVIGSYKIMDLYDSVQMYGNNGNFASRLANKIANRGI